MSRIHEALKQAEQEKALVRARTDPSRAAACYAAESEVIADANLPTAPSKATTPPLVPRFADLLERSACREWTLSHAPEISGPGDESRLAAEQFRTLRSRLYQLLDGKRQRRILVTSSYPCEGKTFVSNNLSFSLVRQAQKRVLLVDTDLRAARFGSSTRADKFAGLTEYLRDEVDEYEILQKRKDSNLYFLPSGASVSDPSELLLGDRMKTLLDNITPLFDWVILDSPPTLLVHDAIRLADLCDGVLFVVRAGSTDHDSAQKAAAEFRSKNLLGVVLNQVQHSDTRMLYYGYPVETP
jgi:capsular exopolysaccharide synthesis family protein